MLPLPLLYRIAWLGYLLLYYIAGYRKAVVRENISRAFPHSNERELTVLAKKYFRQLTDVALEILHARTMSQSDFSARVRFHNLPLLEQYSEAGQQSVIVLSAHQGNWEWMLHGLGALTPMPLVPVYKPLHNATADRVIKEIRSRFGAQPVSVTEVTRNIVGHRRSARLILMLADQAPVANERSVVTTFMQRETAFQAGPEKLARSTGFPVLYAQCSRDRRGYYCVEFIELARQPRETADTEITKRYASAVEAAILAEPQSWLWSNRRWKRAVGQATSRNSSQPKPPA